ncbi:MAG TPA: Amuc_1100 family pilus-like protein [Prosthecobacter sp.]|nr:Amuc_1100 family pilus-like protein [Prosthecobacter sp.]
MSWISENKTPAAIIGVSLAGAIGLGVLLYGAYSKYDESMTQFNTVNRSLQGLKNAPLAPTQANVDAKNIAVRDYIAKADRLATVLNRLQKPDTPTTDVEFQSKLKTKIAETRQLAAERRVQLPNVFNLAFDNYIAELPKSNAVATELSTYLDGVNELTRLLIESGILRIDLLERDELQSEKDPAAAGAGSAPRPQPKAPAKGAPKKGGPPQRTAAPPKVSERWSVRTVVVVDQAGLQALLSKLASPSETLNIPYFPIVRLVRIENERKEGPPMAQQVSSVPPEGGSTPPVTVAPAPGTNADAIQAAKPAPPDSVVILGNEKLRVFLEIDFVKFLQPQAAATTR